MVGSREGEWEGERGRVGGIEGRGEWEGRGIESTWEGEGRVRGRVRERVSGKEGRGKEQEKGACRMRDIMDKLTEGKASDYRTLVKSG